MKKAVIALFVIGVSAMGVAVWQHADSGDEVEALATWIAGVCLLTAFLPLGWRAAEELLERFS